MSAPVIEGQHFPPYSHVEYPKVLYHGGVLAEATRTVHGAEEEAVAVADGFLPHVPPHRPEHWTLDLSPFYPMGMPEKHHGHPHADLPEVSAAEAQATAAHEAEELPDEPDADDDGFGDITGKPVRPRKK